MNLIKYKYMTTLTILCLVMQTIQSMTLDMTPEEKLLYYTNKSKSEKIIKLFETYPHLDSNYKNNLGRTALHNAAQLNNVEISDILISKGALINELDNSNWTPLHVAVRFNSLEAAKNLLDKSADVNIISVSAETPIYIAIDQQLYNMINLLILNGADLNIQNKVNGITPLHAAIYKNNEKIIETLMNNPNTDTTLTTFSVFNENQRNAIQLARWLNYPNIVSLISKKNQEHYTNARKLFLTIKLTIQENKPTLLTQILKENRPVVLMLRQAETGNNLLHLAALRRNLNIIDIVLTYAPELASIKNNAHEIPLSARRIFIPLIKHQAKLMRAKEQITQKERDANDISS